MSALPVKADIAEYDQDVQLFVKSGPFAQTLPCLIGSVASKPSGAPYQQYASRYPATSYDCQCRFWLNTSVPPWARLQNHMKPQQTRGDYQNTSLKIMIDALALRSTFFDRPARQIKSESSNKGRYCDCRRDACHRNEFTEHDARHQECENDYSKCNSTGLPTKSNRSAHFRFSRLKRCTSDSTASFFKRNFTCTSAIKSSH